MSQQLSVKVADVIYQRFLNLYGGDEPTAEQVVATAPVALHDRRVQLAPAGPIGDRPAVGTDTDPGAARPAGARESRHDGPRDTERDLVTGQHPRSSRKQPTN